MDDEETRLMADLEAGEREEREKYQPNKGKGEEPKHPIPLLTYENVSFASWLTSPPPPPDWLFDQVFRKGEVGMICSPGGLGKSYLLLQLALAAAKGEPFGLFKPPRPMTVLYLAAEDSRSIIAERAWSLTNGQFPPNLLGVSVAGEIGPLLEYDGKNNLITSKYYDWLDQSLENIPDIDLILADPKSRLAGGKENDNDANTEFVRCLERLAKKHNTSIIFTHHTSKAMRTDASQGQSRGGSAVEDGCRWVAGMAQMSDSDAASYGVSSKEYVFFNIYKSNNSKRQDQFFRRLENGGFEPTNLKTDLYWKLGNELAEILKNESEEYTQTQLFKENKCGHIRDAMAEKYPTSWKNKKIHDAIESGLKAGSLIRCEVPGKGTKRVVIRIRPDIVLPGEAQAERPCSWPDENLNKGETDPDEGI
ncbi:MAG: AAA family ATPase [Deltaproteobacteria bacterium]|nr:AAA family ATPase [Deltaproteobacteria bacterium]